jgi:hypothetical protein
MKIARALALLTVALSVAVSSVSADDLTAAEILAKHLDSIGTKEKRDSVKTLMAKGLSEFESTNPVIKGGGRAIIVSDPDNLFFVIGLNSREYPFEKVGYFHKDISIPLIGGGQRGLLGSFLANHSKMLSDGLFSGALSLTWSPLSAKPRGKFTGGSTKKIDGKSLYVLDYNVSGGGSKEFTIKLYFDTETFRHVRSEYKYEVESTDAVMGQQNRRASGRLGLTETFSDFREVEGLTLPFVYRIEYESNGNSGSYKTRWGIDVEQWSFNQKLAPDFFTFDAK